MLHLKKETKANPDEFFNICISHSIPFVCYCLPDSRDVTTLVQYKNKSGEVLNYSDFHQWKGFLIAPFQADRNIKALLLEPDLTFTNFSIPEDILTELKQGRKLHINTTSSFIEDSTQKEEFINQVELIKQQITNGSFEKIVLSRILQSPFEKKINLLELFESIRVGFPSTMRYLLFLPGYGCWMGATPEPFLIRNNATIELTSMAGTRKIINGSHSQIQWDTKELQEQQYVTDYMEKVLEKFEVSGYSLTGPFNYRASNVVHLKSVFQVGEDKLGDRLGEFIAELMPTPSVAGMPKEEAIAFIKRTEKHEREFYSGILGPVNMNGLTKLYVNLRSMKLVQNNAFLYAGAGITLGSVAENEWEETNQKLFAMLSVLNGVI